MTSDQTTDQTTGLSTLLAVEPQLFVTDLPRALAFYVERLGFVQVFVHGDPPFYAQVARGGVAINLRHVDQPVIDRSAEPDLLSATFTVDNARPLFEDFAAKGAAFRQTLTREAWHAENEAAFIVEDPDGNLLAFAGRTD